jgi:hypothetical protein
MRPRGEALPVSIIATALRIYAVSSNFFRSDTESIQRTLLLVGLLGSASRCRSSAQLINRTYTPTHIHTTIPKETFSLQEISAWTMSLSAYPEGREIRGFIPPKVSRERSGRDDDRGEAASISLAISSVSRLQAIMRLSGRSQMPNPHARQSINMGLEKGAVRQCLHLLARLTILRSSGATLPKRPISRGAFDPISRSPAAGS